MGWLGNSVGRSAFGSSSTAEDVTDGIDASHVTAIVTGGSGGLGEETVRVLALREAQVVIAARNVTTGENVKETILKCNPTARVHVLELDLASMESVRKFVHNFNNLEIPLNILINNAGIMACPFQLSADGIELQFATNHVGHFLLTNLLMDKLKATVQQTGIEGRIVNVSSYSHNHTYSGGIRFDKLNDAASYSPYLAYGQSKLANILHAKELARRFKEEGVNLTANSVRPGVVRTNITRHTRLLGMVLGFAGFFLKSIPQGAATQCYLALHPTLKGVNGKYFSHCNEAKTSSFGMDGQLAEKLWECSEKLTSVGK
eukprot:c24744_g3_i3 orf=318-1268(-)